jgi:hypothetical protein
VLPEALVAAADIRPNFHIEPLEPGDHVPNVARWLGRVGIEAALTPRLATRAMVRFSGPYTPIGEPGIETQSYAVLDLGTSVQVSALGAVLDLSCRTCSMPSIRRSGVGLPQPRRSPHLRAALRLPSAVSRALNSLPCSEMSDRRSMLFRSPCAALPLPPPAAVTRPRRLKTTP